MKKTIINLAIGTVLALGAVTANASSLDATAVLTVDQGVGGFAQPAAGTGSWFAMEALGPGGWVYTGIGGDEGLQLGGAAQFSEAENVDLDLGNNSEVTSVDNSWIFFGALGSHGHTGVTISDNATAGVAELDFSGWYVTYNNVPVISMGGDPANFPADTQVANITCANDCSLGDTYTLDYAAHVPLTSPSFPGTAYALHLEGTVVPVPAAVWLFGSGLLGLVGVARRKTAA